MGPVLFLDFDGVLNSDEYVRRTRPRPRFAGSTLGAMQSTDAEGQAGLLDPRAIEVLNKIVEERDGRPAIPVVISSSWRDSHVMSELVFFLESRGFKGTVAGRTPSLAKESGSLWIPSHRDDEILAWIRRQPEPPSSFVVIEDEELMPTIQDRVIRTSYDDGLMPRHIEPALAVLARPWDPSSAPSPKCMRCGQEIDPDCCGCGQEPESHAGMGLGHQFVPVGCECFRDKPAGRAP